MAVLIKKLLRPLQMSAVTIHRVLAFTTRNCSQESPKIYNTFHGTLSHNFVDTSQWDHDKIIIKVPKVLDLDLLQVNKLIHTLKELGYTWDDITSVPRVFLMPSYKIFYKKHLLNEFGFHNPRLRDLVHCRGHMKSEISFLKFFGLISEDTDVLQHLWENIKPLKLPQAVFDEAKQRYSDIETTTLEELFIHFLKHYLSQRFNVEVKKIEVFLIAISKKKGLPKGPRAQLVLKGLRHYPAICDTLINSLQYDFNHISINPALLNIYPNCVERLLEEIPTIGGSSIYDIAKEFPESLLIPVQNMRKWVSLLDKYEVTHFTVTKATIDIFSTGRYKMVEERLNVLSQHPELKWICYSDKLFYILRQPYGVKRLVEALETYQPLKSIESAIARKVPKKGLLGKPRLKKIPNELVIFIAHELDLEKEEARNIMESHKFIHFGLTNSDKMINLIKEYGFSREQIINGIEILQFEFNSVNKALEGFSTHPEAQPFIEWMENPYVLQLLIYIIKKNGLYP